jgi:hypothetical protein
MWVSGSTVASVKSVVAPMAAPWSVVEKRQSQNRQSQNLRRLRPQSVNLNKLLQEAAEAEPVPDPKQSHELLIRLRAFFDWRLPGTQKSLWAIFVAVGYIVLNIIAYYVGVAGDPGMAVGYLTAANSFLVALPATRNSVFVLILGIPFDRTIMFHRWFVCAPPARRPPPLSRRGAAC